jgi:hypothetical protein
MLRSAALKVIGLHLDPATLSNDIRAKRRPRLHLLGDNREVGLQPLVRLRRVPGLCERGVEPVDRVLGRSLVGEDAAVSGEIGNERNQGVGCVEVLSAVNIRRFGHSGDSREPCSACSSRPEVPEEFGDG